MAAPDDHFLEERPRISDVVIRYATALDSRDWPLLGSCLTDPVAIDYRSFDPALDVEMPRDEWLGRVEEGLTGFDVTQHLSTNHRFAFDGPDACTCVSYVQALHVLREDGGDSVCTLHGYYTNRLQREGGEWRIRQCQLTITATLGDPGVFARAVERYRQGQTS